MEAVARSYLMAGVALVGAGAIAVGPVQPLPPDVQVPAMSSSAAAVELNALVNPIELWANVFSTTLTNVGDLAGTVLADPAPILGKIVSNQLIAADVFTAVVTKFGSGFVTGLGTVPQQFQDSLNQIQEGDVYQGVINLATAFLSPVVQGAFPALMYLPDIIAVLQNPFENISSVIETAVMSGILTVGFPILTQVLAPAAQIGYTGQAIYDAVQADDFEAVANAVISFPSDMVNTILNSSPPEVGIPGLLGPGGLVSGLLTLRQAIADAIHPPVLSSPPALSVAEAPDLKAASVTVDTASGDVAMDDGAAADDEAPKSTVSAEVVKDSPVIKPSRLGPDTNRHDRGAEAVKTLRTDVQKSVKKFGDKVSKAFGGKAKAEKNAGTAGGGGDE